MANGCSVFNIPRSLLLALLVGATLCAASSSSSTPVGTSHPRPAFGGGRIGWKLGGRTEISDVLENREVQGLGLFAVEEHNRRLGPGGGGDVDRLVFLRVVRAQRQVVSGVKYYLRIAAAQATGGVARCFDAVVVVKPWLDDRDLFSFTPSSSKSKAQ